MYEQSSQALALSACLRLAVCAVLVCTVHMSTAAQSNPGDNKLLEDQQYVVAVDTRDSVRHEAPSGKQVQMLDSQGREYSCWLPAEPDAPTPQGEQKSQQDPLKTPAELLEALSSKCFYKNEDWWQYELCYNKHVKQFHMEGSTTVTEIFLGHFDEAATNLNLIKEKSAQSPEAYVSSQYSRGEKCDLLNRDRQTEVIFTCAPPGMPDQLVSVKEVSTCSYQLSLATRLLCTHARLSAPPAQVQRITCYSKASSQGEGATELQSAEVPQAHLGRWRIDVESAGPKDGHISSSSAQAAHEELVADLQTSGQLEAFQDLVQNLAHENFIEFINDDSDNDEHYSVYEPYRHEPAEDQI